MTNYAGLRNRIGILSEATTYISFKDRVVATDKFVMAVLDYVAANAKRVVDLTRNADAEVSAWGTNPPRTPELGVRFEMAPRGDEETILEKTPEKGQPRPTGRPIDLVRVKMPIYDRFTATKKAKVPTFYVLRPTETKIVDLLRRHGVVVEKLINSASVDAQSFNVKEVKIDTQPFQGHRLVQADGEFVSGRSTVDAGSFVVRMNQPLGVLIFNMLEPESSDGVTTWGFLSSEPKTGDVHPILKVFGPLNVPTERVL